MSGQYLPLTEYSSKHKVSVSTLRRRIKADEIKYRFEDGKYLILDEEPSKALTGRRPSPQRPSRSDQPVKAERSRTPKKAPKVENAALAPSAESSKVAIPWTEEFESFSVRDEREPIISAANRLLSELKRAYTQVLQEKEEQILALKEEISDLKTLVRVLESENARGSRK